MFCESKKGEILEKTRLDLGYKKLIQAPVIKFVSINMTIGNDFGDLGKSKYLKLYEKILSVITGQLPCIVKRRKSVAAFKVRQGDVSGYKITLRRKKANYFLEKLINVAIPEIKNFYGFSVKSINTQGNFALGLRDLSVFPEVNYSLLENREMGMDINIVINSGSIYDSFMLLSNMGFVFHDYENFIKK